MENEPWVPKIVYKYRDFVPHHLDILKKKQIHFSFASDFNDPFDCNIVQRFDLLSEVEFDEMKIGFLINITGMSVSEAVPHYFNVCKGNPKYRQYENRDDEAIWQLNHIRNTVTIFSTSELRDNVLMWSHYSNCHKGFCIGFRVDGLHRDTLAGYGRVQYHDRYPTFKPERKTPQLYIAQVLSKALDWQYEKEWRFTHLDKKKTFDFHASSIEEIIFGCESTVQNIKLVKSITDDDANFNHVRLLRAVRNRGSFLLDIIPL